MKNKMQFMMPKAHDALSIEHDLLAAIENGV